MTAAVENIETGRTVLGAMLGHAAARSSDIALVSGGTSLMWSELTEGMLAFAGALCECGVEPGCRVAILARNSAPAVIAYLGAIAAGGVAVPLPVSATPKSLKSLVADAEPSAIAADDEGWALLGEVPAMDWCRIRLADALERGFDVEGRPDRTSFPLDAPRSMDEIAPFNIIYSSGTTGRPKGIVHSHGMRNRQAARRLFELGPESTMLLSTPLYSNTTLMPMLSAIRHGARVVLMQKFDAARYLEIAEKERATHTMLVPVQYRRLLDEPSFDRRDLSAFRVKQCTSAPMDATLKRDVLRRWPGRFVEVYGLTEGGVTAILDAGRFPGKLDTVGMPAEGNDIRLIGEDGNYADAGEPGEIVGQSHFMMTGYWRNPPATEAFLWRSPEGEVLHRSGDIGIFDADGFLKIVGRKKDLIISGGFNVFPGDLEAVLLEHPDVAEAAVIGVPSVRWGETPLALIVMRAGSKSGSQGGANEVCAWANARLGKMQRLSAVEIRQSLPRSSIGKVLKQELREAYRPVDDGVPTNAGERVG